MRVITLMNRKLLIAAIAVMIIIVGAFALSNNTSSQVGNSVNIDANALKDMGNIVVNDSEDSKEKGLVSASSSDLNSILVTNNGKLTIKDSLVNKTGDTATSGDDADFYGVNSAILVNTNATLDISNVEINTNSKGSNGIFVTNSEASTSSSSQGGSSEGSQPPEATGGNSSQGGAGGQPPEATGNGGNNSQGGEGGQPPEMPSGEGGQAPGNSGGDPSGASDVSGNTEATIKNVKITTHSDKSRGLDATYKGKINAENVIINTDGQSCAALATDRGEGEVHVKNSEINTGVSKTSGRGSPLIYSTGNITVDNTKGTSYVSQIACIEGKNSIEVTNSDLAGYSEGNRKDGDNYVDLGGIFIYQSMSGDADVGTSLFTAKDSKLTIPQESSVYKEAPMFHVTNTKAAMAREILDLRREVLELKASMASGNWMLDPTLTRLFPDTEENHWAYEYVKTLAGNHIIEGYPDGEFKGDQMITRYEMAAILYRAMMNGAKLPDKALNEFADELGRFRVDRIYGNGDDRHKVERIRVNDENRNDRDVYGSRYEYFKQHPGANISTGALPGTDRAERAAKAEAAAKQDAKPSVVSHS